MVPESLVALAAAAASSTGMSHGIDRLACIMSNIRIVPATEAEIPVILDLVQAFAGYGKMDYVVTATEERLRETLFGAKPDAEALLAHYQGECAGLAVFFTNYSTFLAQSGLYLEDLYVRPHLRGQGIGLALLMKLASLAKERGCGRMEWGVLDWNHQAIRFYQKLGAFPVNQWTKYRLTGEALEKLAGRDH
jgi:GNAT superfamily N-acetyltransferase